MQFPIVRSSNAQLPTQLRNGLLLLLLLTSLVTVWRIAEATHAYVYHPIAVGFDGAYTTYAADIDDDGDTDVVAGSRLTKTTVWFENTDGLGQTWTSHIVDSGVLDTFSVVAADVNGDGYVDIVGGAEFAGDVVWWDNSNGDGSVWVKHTIDGAFHDVDSVYAADVNGDGAIDVLATAWGGNDHVTWWQNVNGDGLTWTERTIATGFLGATSVHAADIDGDGDSDVFGSANYIDDVTWWENLNGSGTSWSAHVIDGAFDGARRAFAADVNGDGYLDVLGAGYDANVIAWWQNLNGSGTSWAKHTVVGSFARAIWVHAEDMDHDGDMDILGSATGADQIAWWENINGDGLTWSLHMVASMVDAPMTAIPADFNGDGKWDVLSAAQNDDLVAWWGLNTAPVANDDAYSLVENTSLSVAVPGVLGNDTDDDGDPLTASLISGPDHGSLALNSDGSFDYTPDMDYSGSDSFTYVANDGADDSNAATVSLTITPDNDPPDCSAAAPSISLIWPPNHAFVPVNVLGVTDPEGDTLTLTIDSIYQDEPVDSYGDGDFTPDGQGIGTDTAQVRAERAGSNKVPGDGRFYHITFTATDPHGDFCTGAVVVAVPHNMGKTPVDQGPLFDSTVP